MLNLKMGSRIHEVFSLKKNKEQSMNKKMVLMILALLGASMQVDAMDVIQQLRQLKFKNKTFADLMIFTSQRPGSEPIIVGEESEVLTLNPGEKIYFGSPHGVSLLEIKGNDLVEEHLAAGIPMVINRTSAACVTIEIDKDGYTNYKKGIEGFMCHQNGSESMDMRK